MHKRCGDRLSEKDWQRGVGGAQSASLRQADGAAWPPKLEVAHAVATKYLASRRFMPLPSPRLRSLEVHRLQTQTQPIPPAGPASVPVRTYKRAKRQYWHEVGCAA